MPKEIDTGVFEAVNADLGELIAYDEELPREDAERFEEQLDDYVDAHAEAEAGLQDLSAG